MLLEVRIMIASVGRREQCAPSPILPRDCSINPEIFLVKKKLLVRIPLFGLLSFLLFLLKLDYLIIKLRVN